MIMPDGTKLNSADGFNYEDLSWAFLWMLMYLHMIYLEV